MKIQSDSRSRSRVLNHLGVAKESKTKVCRAGPTFTFARAIYLAEVIASYETSNGGVLLVEQGTYRAEYESSSDTYKNKVCRN